MHWANQSHVTEFILVGFPGILELQLLLFFMFLLAYALTVIENTVIIMLIWANVPLHKPKYLFLGNLSFLEIWYVSVTVPKMLLSFVTKRKSISFIGCMAQLYFFLALACTECVLLAVMAYDRYVAICNPLRYSAIMSQTLCIRLASHLLVVTIFYASSLFIYARPRAISSFDSNKLVSVIYTVLTPLFNPVIYCLRNEEFKDTLRKTVHGIKVFSLSGTFQDGLRDSHFLTH
nr:olfactory receptor 6P1-like [Chrysemys picta bellii]